MLISVIVTTYNRPQALVRVLEGLLNQDDQEYEIIVADDGSSESTRDVVMSFKAHSAVPIKHVWQANLGFRLARCRNLAVRYARGDYLVFLDGDCVPRKDFVRRHRLLSERGYIVAGQRLLLNESLTKKIEQGKENILSWSWARFLLARIKGEVNRLDALLNLSPSASFRYRRQKKWEKTRGCNMGLFKSDFMDINGFDSSFVGWGFEDSDFSARLINAGKGVKLGTFATAVFHLWHPRGSRAKEGPNWDRLQHVLEKNETQPIDGYSCLQLSEEY